MLSFHSVFSSLNFHPDFHVCRTWRQLFFSGAWRRYPQIDETSYVFRVIFSRFDLTILWWFRNPIPNHRLDVQNKPCVNNGIFTTKPQLVKPPPPPPDFERTINSLFHQKLPLQDCLCDSSPFQNGFAHRGAAEASTWLCAEYGESLKYLEEISLRVGKVISMKVWKISCWVWLILNLKKIHLHLCFFFKKNHSCFACLAKCQPEHPAFWAPNFNQDHVIQKRKSGERLRGRAGGPFPGCCRGRRLLCAAARLGRSTRTLRVLRATCHGGSAIGQGSSELHHECCPWWWCDT